jgi:hypothetical protein
MLILPPPRHLWLISFWLVMSLFGGLLIGVLLTLLVSSQWFSLGMIVAIVLALPGLLWPQAIIIPYRVWNILAHRFTHIARLWLIATCFYTIFVVGRVGSPLKLTRPTAIQSLWVQRATLAPATYVSQYNTKTKELPEKGWISTFLSWAVQSGNLWAFCLLPFLILLWALETDQKSSLPTSIYSLY